MNLIFSTGWVRIMKTSSDTFIPRSLKYKMIAISSCFLCVCAQTSHPVSAYSLIRITLKTTWRQLCEGILCIFRHNIYMGRKRTVFWNNISFSIAFFSWNEIYWLWQNLFNNLQKGNVYLHDSEKLLLKNKHEPPLPPSYICWR